MSYFLNFLFFPTESRTTNEKIISAILVFLISGWISYTIFSVSLKSQWSVVDDREIAYFLGGDQKITPLEAWEIYTKDTEVGKYGLFGRFRPAYHAFRLLESLVWNDELIFWYLTNILIFSLFVAVFWYISAEFLGLVVAGLVSFYMATALYWRDVFGRLGPSEPYVVLGICISSFGMYMIYKYKMGRLGWLFVNIGLMICTGSKENTLLFLVLYALIFLDQYRKYSFYFLEWFLLGLTIIWNIWIISAILISFSVTGRDVYQSSIFDKLSSLSNIFFRSDVLLLGFVSLFFFAAIFIFNKRSVYLSKSAFFSGKISVFLLIFYISQCFYYTGDFPNDDRYDVPGLLVGPIALILLVSFFRLVVREYKNINYLYLFFAFLVVTGVAVDIKRVDNIYTVRKEIAKYMKYEKEFTRDVNKLSALADSLQGYMLIFQVSNPVGDYDIILSYDQFLRYYGVNNPIAVYWSGDIPPTDSDLYPYYIDLATISYGGSGALPNFPLGGDFVPLSSFDAMTDKKCILVLFSDVVPQKDCATVFEVSNTILPH